MINIDDKFLKQTPLAEGGEGIIFEYKNDTVIKIYKPHVNLNNKLNKINSLMGKQLSHRIIKPIDTVYQNGKFIGYLMNKVNGEEIKRLSNKKYIKTNKIKIKDIIKILVDIKNELIILHKQNIFIGDLNDANILFDNKFNIYFIDCDSWSIDNDKCEVCMDSFKDPLLKNNDFSADTDSFAFSTLLFKSLTKIHPYGGVTNPDMNIIDRMNKGISVIDNKNVIIPKTISNWNFIPPKLLKEMKEIFETSKRFIINNSIDDFYNNLKLCTKDNEYYYSKFNECPFCNSLAKVLDKPQKVSTSTGVMPMLYLSNNDIEFILSLNHYIDNNNFICHSGSKKKIKREVGNKYYFSNDGQIIYIVSDKNIEIKSKYGEYNFEKINKSMVDIIDNVCYYVNMSNNLIQLTVLDKGNSTKIITKCAFNNIFSFINEKEYFVCNIYDNMKIFNISGYNYTIKDKSKIINYGLHFDYVSKNWLLILESDGGKFNTFVFNKNKLIYENDTIKYTSDLGNICFNNNIIFTPNDGLIKGFSYQKNVYKDFTCDVVNEDSKLEKIDKKFMIINEKEIYSFG